MNKKYIESETNTEKNKNTDKKKNYPPKFVMVEFKGHRRQVFLNSNKLNLVKGNKVLLQIESGIDLGVVVFTKNSDSSEICNKTLENDANIVIKIADNLDLDKDFLNRYDEPDIVYKSNELAQDFEIEMKVVDAEWQFDRQKLTIFFTAPDRIDFRELVKELARLFKTRIELRQINSREETRRLGCGIGCCGQPICCTSFLFDFNQVTIEHAKLQQLSSNVTKLSGNCGRLKCCLLFEYEHYASELANYPPLNSIVELEDGKAILNKIDIFTHTATLYNIDEKKTKTITQAELTKYSKNGKITYPDVSEEKTIKTIDGDIVLEDDF